MYENMTDEEFFAEIEKIYGKEWTPKDIKDPVIADEYARRVVTGV